MADIDRPLAPRGEKDSRAIGRFIRDSGRLPGLVLCSPAVRARQTLALIEPHLGAPEVRVVQSLYSFGDGSDLLAIARTEGGRIPCLMLIGHNPSMARLAMRLSGSGPTMALAAMARGYPTAGLAVITFDRPSWAEIGDGDGRLDSFTTPTHLDAAGS